MDVSWCRACRPGPESTALFTQDIMDGRPAGGWPDGLPVVQRAVSHTEEHIPHLSLARQRFASLRRPDVRCVCSLVQKYGGSAYTLE
jgi:hypothetical protein